jgi:hypothetical protein
MYDIAVTNFSLYTSTIQSNYVLDDLALRGLIRASYQNITGFDITSGKTNIIAIHLPPNVQVNYTNGKTFSELTCSDKICGYNDVVQLSYGLNVSYTVVPYPESSNRNQNSPDPGCQICPGGNVAAQHEFMEAVSRAALKTNYNPIIPEIADYCDGYNGRYSYHQSGVTDFGSSFHSLWSPLTGRCEPSSSTPPERKTIPSNSSRLSSKFYSFNLLSDPRPVTMNNCEQPSRRINYSKAEFYFELGPYNNATQFVFQFYNNYNTKWVKLSNPEIYNSNIFTAFISGNLLFVNRSSLSYTTIQGTIGFSSKLSEITDCEGPASRILQGSLISQA